MSAGSSPGLGWGEGLGFRAYFSGFRVQDFGLKVLGSRVQGFRFRVQVKVVFGLGFKIVIV